MKEYSFTNTYTHAQSHKRLAHLLFTIVESSHHCYNAHCLDSLMTGISSLTVTLTNAKST